MKKLKKAVFSALFISLLLLSTQAFTMAVSAEVTLPTPIGAWNMTEETGDKAIDHGTLKNDGFFGDNTGWIGDFEGKFDKVISPGIVVVDNTKGQYNMGNDFTFAAWVYVSEMSLGSWSFLADNYADEPMTEKEYSPATWTILINTVGNVCVESQGSWGQINQVVAKYDMTKDGEKWRHVAVTFDKETLTFKIYIDGTDMSPYTYINNQIVNPTVVSKAIAAPTDKHRLRFLARDPQTHKLKGRMAMVRIYNETLSQDQVKLLRTKTNGAANDITVAVTSNSSSKTTSTSSGKNTSVAASSSTSSSVSQNASNVESSETSAVSSQASDVDVTVDNGPLSQGLLIIIIVVAAVLVIGIAVALILLLKKKSE